MPETESRLCNRSSTCHEPPRPSRLSDLLPPSNTMFGTVLRVDFANVLETCSAAMCCSASEPRPGVVYMLNANCLEERKAHSPHRPKIDLEWECVAAAHSAHPLTACSRDLGQRLAQGRAVDDYSVAPPIILLLPGFGRMLPDKSSSRYLCVWAS